MIKVRQIVWHVYGLQIPNTSTGGHRGVRSPGHPRPPTTIQRRPGREMKLFYDPRDDKLLERRGIPLLYWLDDLGARPLDGARPEEEGFLFAGARPIDDYRRLVAD